MTKALRRGLMLAVASGLACGLIAPSRAADSPPAPVPAPPATASATTCPTDDATPRGGGPGGGGGRGAAGAGAGGPAAGAVAAAGPPRTPPPPPLRPIANAAPISARAFTGFTDLFDGRDLSGWQGDSKYWSVVGGVLTGQSDVEPTRSTTYLIWRGGTVQDFDLVFEYRLNENGDSGVQYRNQEVPVPNDPLRGPALDLGGRDDMFTGNIFEEQGASFLASHGFFTWEADGARQTIADVAGSAATRACVKAGDWNRGEIIARGDTMIHILNDHVVAVFIDQNPARLKSGVLGIQLHTGTAGKVEFRSLKLKPL